jgi:hypothetical protein
MAIRKLVSFTVSLVFLAIACSKQGEGERCTSSNGSLDCEDGLICMAPASADNCEANLVSSSCKPYRCCPQVGNVPSDNRCLGYSVAGPVFGTGGADAGTSEPGGSTSTSAGASSAGGDTTAGGDTSAGGAGGADTTDVSDAGDNGGTTSASTT